MRCTLSKQVSRMAVLAGAMVVTCPAWALPTQWTIESLGTNRLGSAINGSGQVVVNEFGSYQSWLYSNGTLTSLPANHFARALNNSGQVTGPTNDNRAFTYKDGTASLLPLPAGARYMFASGINDAGQIVGEVYFAAGQPRAYLYDQSGLQLLGANFCSGALQCATDARGGINESGQAVGRGFRDSTNTPLLFAGESFVDLTTRGLTTNAYPSAINDEGLIAGISYESGGAWTRGFVLEGNDVTYFDSFDGFIMSEAYGINNLGHVVGDARSSAGVIAWMYDGSSIIDLNSLNISFADGWVLQGAYDINDAGQIVGYGRYNGQNTGFLLSPVVAVPEPAAYLMLILGLLLLQGAARRRARRNAEARA